MFISLIVLVSLNSTDQQGLIDLIEGKNDEDHDIALKNDHTMDEESAKLL
jgi:hypothetical protein